MKVCCVRGALRSKLWKLFTILNTLSLIAFGLIHNNYYTKSKHNVTDSVKVSSRNATMFGQSMMTSITNDVTYNKTSLTSLYSNENDLTYIKTSLTSLHSMIENKTDIVNASKDNQALPLCPDVPPNIAALKVNIQNVLDANDTGYHNTTKGGEYKPIACKPQESVAIIVPYRDREEHKDKFLKYMHWFLQRQQVHYKIFIVEMAWPATFNRGLLQNVGFVVAQNHYNFSCYIFHDVDLLPTDEQNVYRCGGTITHFVATSTKIVDMLNKHKLNRGYFTNRYVGGVLGLPGSAYRRINGFSNKYFGWGGEDDDVQNRMKHEKLRYIRLPVWKGSYHALPHDRDAGNKINPERNDLLKESKKNPKHYKRDGLNSLQYEIIKREAFNLYEWILVKIDESVMQKR